MNRRRISVSELNEAEPAIATAQAQWSRWNCRTVSGPELKEAAKAVSDCAKELAKHTWRRRAVRLVQLRIMLLLAWANGFQLDSALSAAIGGSIAGFFAFLVAMFSLAVVPIALAALAVGFVVGAGSLKGVQAWMARRDVSQVAAAAGAWLVADAAQKQLC